MFIIAASNIYAMTNDEISDFKSAQVFIEVWEDVFNNERNLTNKELDILRLFFEFRPFDFFDEPIKIEDEIKNNLINNLFNAKSRKLIFTDIALEIEKLIFDLRVNRLRAIIYLKLRKIDDEFAKYTKEEKDKLTFFELQNIYKKYLKKESVRPKIKNENMAFYAGFSCTLIMAFLFYMHILFESHNLCNIK